MSSPSQALPRFPDHYKTLGVAPSADADAIKAAWKAAVKKHHPDVVRGKGAKAGIVPWYVLKRSVTIKPGLRFFETFRRYVTGNMARVLGGEIRKAIQLIFAKGHA